MARKFSGDAFGQLAPVSGGGQVRSRRPAVIFAPAILSYESIAA
jgi:hypothetical protein